MNDRKIIIVRKKRGGDGGHHGGAWKVAYADFVTAMMAFFLVMWIMSMDEGVRDVVEGYFNSPAGFRNGSMGGGQMVGNAGGIGLQNLIMTPGRQRLRFEEVAEAIEREVAETGLVSGMGSEVEAVVTDQGLRIEIMEGGERSTFFDRSSAELKPALGALLEVIAGELQRLPNPVIVEGHTDATRFETSDGYSNWELSVDRANAARRVLVTRGLPVHRILEVRGYADRRLKVPDDPLDAHNRRISLLLPYQDGLIDVAPTIPDPLGDALEASRRSGQTLQGAAGGGGGGPPGRRP